MSLRRAAGTGRTPCPKVASMGREPHMRTHQKRTARSMMSALPRLSLPFPCQARGRGKTFPATIWRFAAKPLILLSVAPELRKFSHYFPAGRENSRCPDHRGALLRPEQYVLAKYYR